ncbi:MAG: hypothetical protein JW902_07280 [Syntrophaceae bacterium]|nr:hypothetical protein [Syntrophaceae bacterium]
MPRVVVENLQEGMKLLRPVTDKNGMVLLSEGTVLTVKWIERIQDMAIEAVYIDGPTQKSIPKEEELARLEARFKYMEDVPHMKLLKKLIREHIEGLYVQ